MMSIPLFDLSAYAPRMLLLWNVIWLYLVSFKIYPVAFPTKDVRAVCAVGGTRTKRNATRFQRKDCMTTANLEKLWELNETT